MAFTGNEGEMVDSNLGQQMINNFQKLQRPIKAVFFGTKKLQQLLGQGNALGIRFYFATNSSGNETLVAVAADANENTSHQSMVLKQQVWYWIKPSLVRLIVAHLDKI